MRNAAVLVIETYEQFILSTNLRFWLRNEFREI